LSASSRASTPPCSNQSSRPRGREVGAPPSGLDLRCCPPNQATEAQGGIVHRRN
jgi:hypothetical protein